MKMITTTNCCFCFGLRTGCLIIGWVQLIFPCIALITDIVAKVQVGNGNTNNTNTITSYAGDSNGVWGDIILQTFQIIMAVCLLYGIYASRKKFVYYYVYAETVLVVLQIILVIVLLIAASYSNVAITIGYSIVSWVIWIYWIIVVFSYYKEMAGHD